MSERSETIIVAAVCNTYGTAKEKIARGKARATL